MPMQTLTLLASFLLAAPALARQNIHPVVQLEYQIFHALQTKDVSSIRSLVADDFHLRTPGNPDSDKAAFLKSVSGNPYKIISVEGDDLQVNVYGRVAVLTGTQKAVVELESGRRETSLGVFTDIFEKRGDKWRLVLAHSVELPPTAR